MKCYFKYGYDNNSENNSARDNNNAKRLEILSKFSAFPRNKNEWDNLLNNYLPKLLNFSLGAGYDSQTIQVGKKSKI